MGVAYRLVSRRLEEVGRHRLPLKARVLRLLLIFVCTHGQAQERSYSQVWETGGGEGEGLTSGRVLAGSIGSRDWAHAYESLSSLLPLSSLVVQYHPDGAGLTQEGHRT